MPDDTATSGVFSYEAQTAQGQTLRGTIDSPEITAASQQLQALQLLVTRLEPTDKPSSRRSFKPADFLVFNQQLAQLTAGGLPIEKSLRLMAAEMRTPRQANAVRQIAAELEKGVPIGQAFDSHRASFPRLYGTLLDAGVRSNNLPAMLLNLGRHVEMMQRLRAAIWRAASYPLMVMVALLLVMSFIWFYVMPQFAALSYAAPALSYSPPGNSTQGMLETVLPIGRVIGFALMGIIAVVLLLVVLFSVISRWRMGQALVEPLVLPLPLIGSILRWNLLARWCDALHLGVQAGLDLPAAIHLAADAVDSRLLRNDSAELIDAVSAGRSLETAERIRLLPPLIPTSLQLAAERNDLPASAAMLAEMYREQAEIRVSVLPHVLAPLLLILTAASISIAIASALLPLIAVIRSLAK